MADSSVTLNTKININESSVASTFNRIHKMAEDAMSTDTLDKELPQLVKQAEALYNSISKTTDSLKLQKELEGAITLQKQAQRDLDISTKQKSSIEDKLTRARNIGDTKSVEKYQAQLNAVSTAIAEDQQLVNEFGKEIDNLNAKLSEMSSANADVGKSLTFEDSKVQASGLLDVLQQIEEISQKKISQRDSSIEIFGQGGDTGAQFEQYSSDADTLNGRIEQLTSSAEQLAMTFLTLGKNFSGDELESKFYEVVQSATGLQSEFSNIESELAELRDSAEGVLPKEDFEQFSTFLSSLFEKLSSVKTTLSTMPQDFSEGIDNSSMEEIANASILWRNELIRVKEVLSGLSAPGVESLMQTIDSQLAYVNQDLEGIAQQKTELAQSATVDINSDSVTRLDEALGDAVQKEQELIQAGSIPEGIFVPLSEGAYDANHQLQMLVDNYNDAKNKLSAFKAGKIELSDEEFVRQKQILDEAGRAIEEYQEKLLSVQSTSAQPVSSAQPVGEEYVKGSELLRDAISYIGSVSESAKEPAQELFEAIKSGASSAVSGVKKLLSSIGSSLVNGFKRLKKSIDNAFSPKSMKRGLTTLLKYTIGVRSLYFLFRKLRNAVKEGLENLVQYEKAVGTSKEIGSTNYAITELRSSLLYLKNAWAAAFAPVINIVVPILNTLIDYIASVGNAIARFIGSLTGQSKVLNAVRVSAGDYADSLDKAGSSAGGAAKNQKKLNDRLAAFDDLNVLGKDNDTGSGGSGGGGTSAYTPDPSEMFEYVDAVSNFADMIEKAWRKADFTKVGEALKDKIKSALEGINWEEIQGTVNKIGSSIGTFLAGFLGDPELFTDIGNAAGNALNTITYGVQSLLEKTKGIKLGANLAAGLNEFFNTTDWKQAGDNINEFITQIADNIYDFADNLDEQTVVEAIIDFFEGLDIGEIAIKTEKALLKLTELTITVIGGVVVEGGEALGEKWWKEAQEGIYDEIGGEPVTLEMEIDPTINEQTANASLLEAGLTKVGKGVIGITGVMEDADTEDISAMAESWKNIEDLFKPIASGPDFGQGDSIPIVDAINSIKDAFKEAEPYLKEVALDVIKQDIEDITGIDVDALASTLKDIKDTFTTGFEGITSGEFFTTAWSDIKDVFNDIGDWVTDKGESVKQFFEDMSEYDFWYFVESGFEDLGLLDGIMAIGDWVTDKGDKVKQFFEDLSSFDFSTLVEDLKDIGTDLINGLEGGISDALADIGTWLDTNVVQPIVTNFCDLLGIDTTESTTFKDYGVAIMQGLLNGIDTLKEDVKQKWEDIKQGANEKFTSLKEKVVATAQNIKDKIEAKWVLLKSATIEKFTDLKEKIIEIWNKIKEGIKAPINAAIGFIESFVNKVIRGINSLIDKINSIADVQFTNPFTNETYTLGFNIPRLSTVTIPRLAQGAVIPPNKEFMAVLGDQTSGTNIEAPLDTIKQAVAEELSAQLDVLQNGFASVVQAINNKDLNIGDKQIGMANARYNARQNLIRGTSF